MNRSGRAMVCWLCVAAVVCGLSSDLLGAERGNAALLYYQALVQCPDVYELPREVIRDVMQMEFLPPQARQYVEENRAVIDLVDMAAEGDQCDWGVMSDHATRLMLFSNRRMRTILFLVAADAQIMQADGDDQGSLARLLTLRPLAGHMAADPNWGSLPNTVDSTALTLVRLMLGKTAPDEEVLTWLRGQLDFEPFPEGWLPSLIQNDYARFVHRLSTGEMLSSMRESVPRMSSNTYRAKQESWSALSDEELIELIRSPYAEFVEEAIEILADEKPYGQTRAALDDLVGGVTEAAHDDPALVWTGVPKHNIPAMYGNVVWCQAALEAVRGGVEIYSIVAETGRLPETLPEDFPKDPSSQEAFIYEVLPDGFALSCHVQLGNHNGRFEFRLPGLSQKHD